MKPPLAGYCLPYGAGRSYGDSCLNNGHSQCPTKFLDMLVDFDEESGLLRAEAGCSIADILRVVVPRGWFVPVTPGTRYVTLGGAVANDVHGKNHHSRGCFGRHVEELKLWRTDGETIVCGPSHCQEWFAATVGGLGLTGLIVEVSMRLRKIPSTQMDVCLTPFSNLDEFFAINEASEASNEYTVAWVDSLSRHGRGIYISGTHSTCGKSKPSPRSSTLLDLPHCVPGFLLNRASIRMFNHIYYRASSRRGSFLQDMEGFFYPLDSVGGWNNLYGKRGLQQYQCVIPMEGGSEACREILRTIADSRQGGFLSVLKTFGPLPSPGILSFPLRGITLAVDFANSGPALERLFGRLDSIVLAAGGRLYPAKDARMKAEDFRRYYPRWGEVEKMRDRGISSSFWRRVTDG